MISSRCSRCKCTLCNTASRHRKRRSVFLAALFWGAAAFSREGPFDVAVREVAHDSDFRIEIQVRIPPKHHIYAESWRVRSDEPGEWAAVEPPPSEKVFDTFSEEEKDVFRADFTTVYKWTGEAPPASVVVEWQGCDERVCFFPEEKRFSLRFAGKAMAGESSFLPNADVPPENWKTVAERFEIVAREAGYLGKEEFLAFLNDAVSGRARDDALTGRIRQAGPWLGALLILLGGLALNLTPCVLPMIPVNLAIIGAGARAGSKRRGFLLGSVYGLGMALAYGALGIIAVVTGATFGALNASPWFNGAIAILFVVLALAAFEVILIDFSRFQRLTTSGMSGVGAHFGTVFVLGVISALLAGACVAPVVISVLLLTSSLYGQGIFLAALLPFLLGIGMALPWPLAGAGLALLPKPGGWMKWVNRAFGVLILAMALYYGNTAWRLFQERADGSDKSDLADRADPENRKLANELARALREQKPVFVDFWATWCKNCVVMERTTFREPEVAARLRDFTVIKYQAENPDAATTKPVLQHFGVAGLPTYVVLKPRDRQGGVP